MTELSKTQPHTAAQTAVRKPMSAGAAATGQRVEIQPSGMKAPEPGQIRIRTTWWDLSTAISGLYGIQGLMEEAFETTGNLLMFSNYHLVLGELQGSMAGYLCQGCTDVRTLGTAAIEVDIPASLIPGLAMLLEELQTDQIPEGFWKEVSGAIEYIHFRAWMNLMGSYLNATAKSGRTA